MEIFSLDSSLSCSALADASCAFGVFDGVHMGHRFLVEQAIASAKARGVGSAIITFDRDPDEVFCPEGFKKLMTNRRRIEALSELGADAVVAIPFEEAVYSLSPTEFLEGLFGEHTPSEVHVGYDFRYGVRAGGDVASMAAWGERHGMGVEGHGLFSVDGAPVTATRIRGELAAGEVRRAMGLLGAPYAICAPVEPGRGEGRNFGIRTANLEVPELLLAVGEGVYGCYASVGGRRYRAAVSVGVTPTFKDASKANVEVHILDFDGDIYGDPVTVEFIEWLRPMREFSSKEELMATINGNIEWVRANL